MLSLGKVTIPDLKKKGDLLDKICEKLLTDNVSLAAKDPVPKKELQSFQKKCADLKKQCRQILQKADKMKVDAKIADFSEKKLEQTNRFETILAKVDEFSLYESKGLSTPSTPGLERADPPQEVLEEKEEDEEEGEGEPSTAQHEYDQPPHDDEETEEHEQIPQASTAETEPEIKAAETEPAEQTQFDAMTDFEGTEPGDLSFKRGETLAILATRPDGWWQAENANGERGLVPSNKLRNSYEEISQPDIEQMQEEEVTGPSQMMPETPEVQEQDAGSVDYTKRWSGVRKQLRQRSVNEMIETMGALPQGIVPSELAIRQSESSHLSLSCHLLPRLSESNLGFHDLYWNNDANKLRKRRVRVLKCGRILKCENMIPTTDLAGLIIQHRFVKLCLYDGSQVVSNVHSIIAQYNQAKPKLWTFLEKINDKQSCAEFGDFFVRSNYADKKVVLLIEVGLSFKKTNTQERGELTCGWTTLPLLNESGQEIVEDKYVHIGHEAIANKKHELLIKTGSPFDEQNRSAEVQQKSALRSKMGSDNPPKIIIKVFSPSQSNIEYMDGLPDVLVWNTIMAPFTFWYRYLAGQTLIRDRTNPQSAQLIPDMFLATFPYAVQEPDLMDVVRIIWAEKNKSLTKYDKKSEDAMAIEFRKIFVKTGAVLLNTALLPPYTLSDVDGLKV